MGLAVWCHDQAGPFQTVCPTRETVGSPKNNRVVIAMNISVTAPPS
jgi:hypothetical protein